MIFVSCGPQILNRPLTNDSKQVFTVLNQIKYSKKDEYKDLLYDKASKQIAYWSSDDIAKIK